MKVVKKLKLSSSETYQTLIDSLLAENKNDTGKNVTAKDYENGYKYKKRVKQGKKEFEATVHIQKPIVNKYLGLKIFYPNETYYISYTIEKVDDKSCIVTYNQEQAKNKKETFFDKFFFKWTMKRRFRKMEKLVIKNRGK